MSDTLGSLMERNLLEVFGQRDSARRAAAIAELYTADCTFFEAEEQVNGRKRSTRRSGVFSRMLPDSCFARQGLRRSITILAVCGGSSDRWSPAGCHGYGHCGLRARKNASPVYLS